MQIRPPACPAAHSLPRFRQRLMDFRWVFGRFTFVHLLSSHLPIYSTDFWTVAHHQGLLSPSSTAWFGACDCPPTPRDLPSSLTTATESHLLLTFVPRHTERDPAQRPPAPPAHPPAQLRLPELATSPRELGIDLLDRVGADVLEALRGSRVASVLRTDFFFG